MSQEAHLSAPAQLLLLMWLSVSLLIFLSLSFIYKMGVMVSALSTPHSGPCNESRQAVVMKELFGYRNLWPCEGLVFWSNHHSKQKHQIQWVEFCVWANGLGIDFSGASESTKLLLDLAGLCVGMVCLHSFSLYEFSFICAASLKSSWDLRILCFSFGQRHCI